jgi:hypothetical protein
LAQYPAFLDKPPHCGADSRLFDAGRGLTTPLINTQRHYTDPEFEKTTAGVRAVG